MTRPRWRVDSVVALGPAPWDVVGTLTIGATGGVLAGSQEVVLQRRLLVVVTLLPEQMVLMEQEAALP